MSVGPPYSVEQTTANACPSSSVMTVLFKSGQRLRSRFGVAVRATVVPVAPVKLDGGVVVSVGVRLVALIAD